jgi:hypothetical protein
MVYGRSQRKMKRDLMRLQHETTETILDWDKRENKSKVLLRMSVKDNIILHIKWNVRGLSNVYYRSCSKGESSKLLRN